MISTRSAALVIDTVVCLTLAKWETVSGRFGGYLTVALQVSIPLEHQGLHVPRQREVRGREHRIGAFAGILDHLITAIVDEVGVVPRPAGHDIGPGSAVEQVAAR